MTTSEPRKPLSVGAVVVWTIINPLFGLIALSVRNKAIRDGEPRVTEEATTRPPAHPMGPVFRIVMLIIVIGIFAALSREFMK